MASFLGITTSKHISGTTLYHSKHITKQGPPNARFAAVNLAGKLCRYVPKYQQMYRRIKERKPPRQGHFIALVAIAREAYRRKTGARALRGIIEELMLDVMYELPSRKDLKRCMITREMVEQRSTADLLLHPSSMPKPESA
jgi:hypothetical protein